MKLLTAKKRKIAIIFTGGLGDTLLFVPLLKKLQQKQFNITAVFYAVDNNDCLLDDSLVNHKIRISTKAGLLLFALTNPKRFVNFYINHLGKGTAIHWVAKFCSYRVTQTPDHKTGNSKQFRNIPVEPGLSDAEQNLRMLYTVSNAAINSIKKFYLPNPKIDQALIARHLNDVHTGYYIIQVSAGNNNTPFKNWPIQKWIAVITKLSDAFKNISFIIVGDAFETAYTAAFENLKRPNCRVLIGKTSIPEVFNLVAFSSGYIGLDSGIMHMAVVLQKKTLTIFGASNEKLYGYSTLDNNDHAIINSSISCRPCSAWKNANTSRVSDPMQCPDFACLTGIGEDIVYNSILTHFNLV